MPIALQEQIKTNFLLSYLHYMVKAYKLIFMHTVVNDSI